METAPRSDIGAVEFSSITEVQSGPDYVVNQSDGACGLTDCTLREAISAANERFALMVALQAAGYLPTLE